MPKVTASNLRDKIFSAVSSEIDEQQPVTSELPQIALLYAGLVQLQSFVKRFPVDATANADIDSQIKTVTAVQAGDQPVSDLGSVLANLYVLRETLNTDAQAWISANLANPKDTTQLDTSVLELISRLRQLMSARPDVTAIMDDLTAIKNLRGGPADAVAFHDFHALQMATKAVWLHAFDNNLKGAVEQLYQKMVEANDQSPIAFPATDAIEDVSQLRELLSGISGTISQAVGQPIPPVVSAAFPGCDSKWWLLSPSQQSALIATAGIVTDPSNPSDVVDGWRKIGQ